MTLPSVLVVGPGPASAVVAATLARRGMEVALVGPVPAAGTDESALVAAVREEGVEVRLGTALIGYLELDTHVEAELSDGRVENFDAVISPARRSDGGRVIALSAVSADDALSWANALVLPER